MTVRQSRGIRLVGAHMKNPSEQKTDQQKNNQ